MTTAFVLSGGGSLGAVQVGMLQALSAQGIEPDLLVGTSAGAVNATWVAAHGMSRASLDRLASVWTGLRRRDVFPLDVRAALSGLLGRSPAVISPDNLRRIVTAHADVVSLDQARIPVHLVAADLLSGEVVPISTGSPVTGVLASAAIPGIFPPVPRDGRYLVDGGVANRTGLAHAVALGAEQIYVLPAGTACALPAPPASAIGTALHALTLLIEQRVARDVAALADTVSIKVLPPLCPLRTSAVDFTRAAELIARARAASAEWILGGNVDLPEPEQFLSAHRHLSPEAALTRRPSA